MLPFCYAVTLSGSSVVGDDDIFILLISHLSGGISLQFKLDEEKKKDGCSVRSSQHGRVIILYSFTETRAKAVLKVEILSQHNWVCQQRGYLIMVKIILLHAQQIAFSWVWVFCGIENKMFVCLFIYFLKVKARQYSRRKLPTHLSLAESREYCE